MFVSGTAEKGSLSGPFLVGWCVNPGYAHVGVMRVPRGVQPNQASPRGRALHDSP